MSRKHAYEDDPTVTAYVDAQEEDLVVPCVHTAPAPGTMPFVPREACDELSRSGARPLFGWPPAGHPYHPNVPAPPSSHVAVRAPYAPSHGHTPVPPHVHASHASHPGYPMHPSAGWSVSSGVRATPWMPAPPTTSSGAAMSSYAPSEPVKNDFTRNLVAVCLGLLAALAIGTAAVVIAAGGKRSAGDRAVAPGAAVAADGNAQAVMVAQNAATPAGAQVTPAPNQVLALHAQTVRAAQIAQQRAAQAAHAANAAHVEAAQAEAQARAAEHEARAAEAQAIEAAQNAQQRAVQARAAQEQAAEAARAAEAAKMAQAAHDAQAAQAVQVAQAVRAQAVQAQAVQAPVQAPAPVAVASPAVVRRPAAAPARTAPARGDDERSLALEVLRAAGEHPTL